MELYGKEFYLPRTCEIQSHLKVYSNRGRNLVKYPMLSQFILLLQVQALHRYLTSLVSHFCLLPIF
jgi:hypothetical protein